MTRPKVHDESLRASLIEEASKVIAKDGVAGLNLRRVAMTTGTSTTAIYSLFGSRDDLIAAVTFAAFAGLAESQAAVPLSDDPFADLMAVGREYRRWALANPNFYVGMFREPTLSLATPTAMDPVRGCVARCVQHGLFVGHAETLSLLFWTIVHGFVSLEIEGHFAMFDDRDAMYDQLLLANAVGWVGETHNPGRVSSPWLREMAIRLTDGSVA